jgi:hypothetical protein
MGVMPSAVMNQKYLTTVRYRGQEPVVRDGTVISFHRPSWVRGVALELPRRRRPQVTRECITSAWFFAFKSIASVDALAPRSSPLIEKPSNLSTMAITICCRLCSGQVRQRRPFVFALKAAGVFGLFDLSMVGACWSWSLSAEVLGGGLTFQLQWLEFDVAFNLE